jgi:alpha-tubulin suppressor-like RCC1 family protein
LTCGGWHSCGISAGGKAWCWGLGFSGQLGSGTSSQSSGIPVQVLDSVIVGKKAFVQITAGEFHSCGLSSEGIAYCWGSDDSGQLGNPEEWESIDYPIPVDQPAGVFFLQLAAGRLHTCGLSSGGVAYCWGSDGHGQLGNGDSSTNNQQSPTELDLTIIGDVAFVQLAMGDHHTCGLTAQGTVHCWGDGSSGQLGNYKPNLTRPEDAVETSQEFVHLVAAHEHTCGVTPTGGAFCWGSDIDGVLGNGTQLFNCQNPCPVDTTPIDGVKAFSNLAGGQHHTCGITGDGVSYCWGNDTDGQVGNGNVDDNTQSPSAVDMNLVQ